MFNRKSIIFSSLLFLPALAVYVFYFINTPSDHFATGFIQSDMYSYMAEARQYVDGENNGIFYSNPFDGDKNAPKIYFQPQIFILGMMLNFAGLNPSVLFLLFGLLFGWLFMIAAISLYSQFFELKSKINAFGLVVFIYGGGALFFSGLIWMLFKGFYPPNIEIFRYDPGYGWWMLNLGRNLIYPLESYYHFLVLFAFVLYFKNKHYGVLLLLLILSWSHPFYGIEFLSVFEAIYLFEFLRYKKLRSAEKQTYFPFVIILILFCIHVYYYLVFLPSFSSHQSLMNQWKINWSHSGITLIFAYIFGIVFTVYAIKLKGGFSNFFSDYKNRVLGIWFVVCFLFVNHHWFIQSYQPLHFDKGYVLAPLWLMGLPSLFFVFNKIKEKRSVVLYRSVILVFFFILFSDNLAWFTFARGDRNSYLLNSEKEALVFLDKNYTSNNLLISNNDEFSYKAMVFTSTRALMSHGYNTPFYEFRKNKIDDLLKNKIFSNEAKSKSHVCVFVVENVILEKLHFNNFIIKTLFANNKYHIYNMLLQ